MQRLNSNEPVIDWRALPAADLERQFNPRVAVVNAEDYLAARTADSVLARKRIPGEYDLRYGPAPKQTYDLHRPENAAGPTPALIFIHGGYWRALDKSDHSFVAPAFVKAGMTVVSLNYDLCPSVTLKELAGQVIDGVEHVLANAGKLGLDPARIYLMGHSAGAHLAAVVLSEDWRSKGLGAKPIRAAICASGIYDPQVVRLISVNNEVQLTPDMAVEMNVLKRPPLPGPAILVTVGGDEPSGWIGQSVAYHALCLDAGAQARLEIVPGTNHFTVLSTAVDETCREHRLVMDFIRAH